MTYGYLSDTVLLAVWEHGSARNAPTRALDMLVAAFPTRDAAALAALPLGQRDSLLMQVRQQTLGEHLEARATCPACREQLELVVALADLLAAGTQDDASGAWSPFEWEGWNGTFRLPTGEDLIAIANCEDAATARKSLLERCIQARYHEDAVSSSVLPAEVQDRVSEQMNVLDPLADIQLVMACPNCDCHWNIRLDIATYLWVEICVEAQLILQEVHQLAITYHWRESDILTMSRLRRRYYLGLVHS